MSQPLFYLANDNLARRGRSFYRGYGAGFPVSSTGFDSRSPAGFPGAAGNRVYDGRYGSLSHADFAGLGTAAQQEGAATTAGYSVATGFPIWESVLAGMLVWALTKGIDRFFFKEGR